MQVAGRIVGDIVKLQFKYILSSSSWPGMPPNASDIARAPGKSLPSSWVMAHSIGSFGYSPTRIAASGSNGTTAPFGIGPVAVRPSCAKRAATVDRKAVSINVAQPVGDFGVAVRLCPDQRLRLVGLNAFADQCLDQHSLAVHLARFTLLLRGDTAGERSDRSGRPPPSVATRCASDVGECRGSCRPSHAAF